MTSAEIDIRGLTFTYASRRRPALRGVDLEVRHGETVLVLGPSGSGKSTLALCLDGLIPHVLEGDYTGTVAVAGLVTASHPVHVLAQQAGLVFQDPEAQFCTITVEDEVAFGLENLGRHPAEIEGAIDAALELVGLRGFRTRRLAALSGGEKQRVAIAAVLAMGPRVLVLDEPSANLDPHATGELFDLLSRLATDGRHTIVIIEHKLDELIDWVDSVLVLGDGGEVFFRGSPEFAFYDLAEELDQIGVWQPQASRLVRALRTVGWRVEGCPLSPQAAATALADTPGLLDALRTAGHGPGGNGRSDPVRRRRATQTVSHPRLEARGLDYAYPDGHVALRNVSLRAFPGHLLAIVGANGAGKTTLASLLTGVLSPPPASVFLDGVDAATLSLSSVSDLVGHVFQNPEHQFVSDTVRGELAFSLNPKAGRKPGMLTGPQAALVDGWLDRLGLLALAAANPFSLSQGQKRRLSVAAMLIRGQEALVLDEPTLGQDMAQSANLMRMLESLGDEGRTLAMVTHDMGAVAEHADSLLVLDEGRVLHEGDPAHFFSQPALVAAAGLSAPPLARMSWILQRDFGAADSLYTLEGFTGVLRSRPSRAVSRSGVEP